MEYKDYIKLISEKRIRPVCLMTGEEEYVKKSVIDRLIKAYVDETMLEFDLSVFDDETANYNDVMTALSSPSMISERKAVVVNTEPDSEFIKDERLAPFCKGLGDDTLLVINVNGKPDKRLSAIKKLEELADNVSFEKIEKTDVIKWISQHFKTLGKQISPSDADYLMSLVGDDLYQLQSEIAKLADFTDERSVTRQDIETMIAHTPEHGVFALVDAVAAKNVREAVKQARLLLNDGNQAFQLLALLERQYQLILRYLGMSANGYQQKEIMDKLALKGFVYDKVKRQAQGYSVETCKKALQLCLDLDYSVKSGKTDAAVGFETLVLKLSQK